MLILLNFVMLLTLAIVFLLTVAYFYNLYIFKNHVRTDHPQLWIKEKSSARPFESSFQSSYRLFRKFNNKEIDGIVLSVDTARICARLRVILYSDLTCFSLFLISALSLTFLDPMK